MINERAKKLGNALVAVKILTPQQLKQAIDAASKDNAPSLIVGLLETGLLTFKIFEKFVSSTMGIQSAIVGNRPFVKEVVDLVGQENIEIHMIYPFALREEKGSKVIALGMVDPTDEDVIDFLQKKTGCRIIPILISLPDFKETMKKNFHMGQVNIETNNKESFVVLRGGEQEEEIKGHGNVTGHTVGSGNTKTRSNFQTAKLVQPKPGWDQKTLHFDPRINLGDVEFLGKNNKKFREEILARLDLDPVDAQQLTEPNYVRETLIGPLKNIAPLKFQKIYNTLPIELKIEALANALIKAGLISKQDLLVSGAVSLAFNEEKREEDA